MTSEGLVLTGRVKWFNNKKGFGFITITDGNQSGKDIFVHHSSINVATEQYKYLVQGEYVDFTLMETTKTDHKYQAVNVKGIKGGSLMCETRRELKVTRTNFKEEKKLEITVAVPEKEEEEWSRVVKDSSVKKRGRKPKVVV